MEMKGNFIGIRAIILYVAILLALIGAIVADTNQGEHWIMAMGVLLPAWFLVYYLFEWVYVLFIGVGSMVYVWPAVTASATLTKDSDAEAGYALLAIAGLMAFVDTTYITGMTGQLNIGAHLISLGLSGVAFLGSILLWSDDGQVSNGSILFLWTILFLVADLNSSKFATVVAAFLAGILQFLLLIVPIADGSDSDAAKAGGVFGWIATLGGFLFLAWKVTGKGMAAVAELKSSWKSLRVLLLTACVGASLFGSFFAGDKTDGWVSVNAMTLPLVLIIAHVEAGDRQELIYFFSLGVGLFVSQQAWVRADLYNGLDDDDKAFGHAMHIITSWACWVAVAPFDKLRAATLGMGCIKSLWHWIALAAHGASVLGAIIIWGYVDEQDASGKIAFSIMSLMSTFMFFAYQNFFVESADVAVVFTVWFTFVQGQLMTEFLSTNDAGGPDAATMEAGAIICWAAVIVYTFLTVFLAEKNASDAPAGGANTGAAAGAGAGAGAGATTQPAEPAADPDAAPQYEDDAQTYDNV